MSEVFRRNARVEKRAADVRKAKIFGHRVTAEQDRARAARSKPDWKAHCSCGWAGSKFHYGQTEALASSIRHLTDRGLYS